MRSTRLRWILLEVECGEITVTNQPQRVPTILDRDKSGGEVAETGFGVQENVQLCCLPRWLSQDGFTQMSRESYADCEARLFRPGLGYRREFVEVKDRVLQPTAFWHEINTFHAMDKPAPEAYERFVLYAELSAEVQPIRAALERVRKSIPFYSDVSVYTDANYAAFVDLVVKKDGTPELASFLLDKVFLVDHLPSPSAGEALFIGELTEYFPDSAELPKRLLAAAYSGLRDLIKKKGLNVPISRKEIEAAILEGTEGRFPFRPLCLYTCANQEPPVGPLVMGWQRFFGGTDRSYPDAADWDSHVMEQLSTTLDWAKEHHSKRVILLNGERRLSGAIAIGAIFSAVSGFVIHQTYRDGAIWRTDDHPDGDTPPYVLSASQLTMGTVSGLIVSVSILGDIAAEIEAATPGLGLAELATLHLRGSDPVVSAPQANRIANDVKERIREALRQCIGGPLHLFYKGPSHVAVFLAHRLNAVAEIRCYEWVGTNRYVPTCTIPKG